MNKIKTEKEFPPTGKQAKRNEETTKGFLFIFWEPGR
jgi:hypothetical protein